MLSTWFPFVVGIDVNLLFHFISPGVIFLVLHHNLLHKIQVLLHKIQVLLHKIQVLLCIVVFVLQSMCEACMLHS